MKEPGTQVPYWMPPEWMTHERTFVSWPVQSSMCQPDMYAGVCHGYADMIAAIAEFEPVTVLVNPGEEAAVRAIVTIAASHASFHAMQQANPPGSSSDIRTNDIRTNDIRTSDIRARDVHPAYPVSFLTVPHNDSWLRDNGPTFVRTETGERVGINWRFNAWGGKYTPWDLDDAVAPAILSAGGLRRVDAPLVMEGGSFHTDGEGTLLTTEQCLLHPNRNPSLTREEIAFQLQEHLGIETILWLGRGLDGDETDGHIDNLACFAAPGKVLLQVCQDRTDPNADITDAALSVLARARDACGRVIEVIEIPQPPRRMGSEGRLTLSYLNFYFVNGGLILPVFGGDAKEMDLQAIRILSDVFPERRIRTIDGMAIVTEGGNVHCATQQMPANEKVHRATQQMAEV